MQEQARIQTGTRFPVELRDWLAQEAERNGSSINSEVIRAVRERMDRLAVGRGDQSDYGEGSGDD